MKLDQARLYADKILAWLAPHCERVELAGAIRREQPVCKRVEVTCIPKPKLDLFGDVEETLDEGLRQFLQRYLDGSNGEAWQRSAAGVPFHREAVLFPCTPHAYLLHLRKCDLDIHIATPENWVFRHIYATGSKDHTIWIDARAKALMGSFDTFSWLRVRGERVQPSTEQEFYAALELPFIEPKNRELPFLNTLWKMPEF